MHRIRKMDTCYTLVKLDTYYTQWIPAIHKHYFFVKYLFCLQSVSGYGTILSMTSTERVNLINTITITLLQHKLNHTIRCKRNGDIITYQFWAKTNAQEVYKLFPKIFNLGMDSHCQIIADAIIQFDMRDL